MSRILAIDTSGPVLGLCLLDHGTVTDSIDDHSGMRHTENLLPAIEALLLRNNWTGPVDAISVASGPGSFTGLRIGMATAKGLALGWGCPVISVDTLEGLAVTERVLRSAAERGGTGAEEAGGIRRSIATDAIIPVLDARKNRFYTAVFVVSPGGNTDNGGFGAGGFGVRRETEDLDISLEDVEVLLRRYETPCVPGPDAGMMEGRFGTHPAAASGRSGAPGIAIVGDRRLADGVRDDPYQGPFYLRETDIGVRKDAPRFTPD